MSPKITDGVKGLSMAERMTPSQKGIYENSLSAFKTSKTNAIIRPHANNILTQNSMLHATSPSNLTKILDNGITTGDLRGNIGSGTGCATQTQLCADFRDVQNHISIKDYFTRKVYNPGEANFLPKNTVGGLSNSRNAMVFVVDKKSVAPTIIKNSFRVTENEAGSILYKDGNMAGHSTYITHRAVPIEIPSNAIDRSSKKNITAKMRLTK